MQTFTDGDTSALLRVTICTMAQSPVPPLVVDPTKTVDENLELFWQYLDAVDPAYAAILRGELSALQPLPSSGAARTKARRMFNAAVAAALDAEVDQESKK